MQNTINAILVDDEESGLNVIRQLLLKYCPLVHIVAECRSAAEAKDRITALNPDLVFLDISMPGKNAFEMLAEMKKQSFEIIFITAHSEYSLQAFRYSAVDYLLKPVAEDLLIQAVEKAIQRIKEKDIDSRLHTLLHNFGSGTQAANMKLCIASVKGFQVVEVKDILYLEAESCYTKFHLLNKQMITASRTIAEYEELLQNTSFCRVHKSFLVNLNYFKEYQKGDGGVLVLNNGERIDVSRRKKDEFMQKVRALFKL